MKLFGNTGHQEEKKGSRVRFWVILILAAAAAVFTVGLFLKNVVFRLPDIETDLLSLLDDPNGGPEFDLPSGVDGSGNVLGRKDRYYTFLLAGLDNGGTRTDVLMAASFDVVNKKINVISIPRDTMANTERSLKKINGAYQQGKAEQTLEEVKTIIGVRPDYYAVVDLKAFKLIVDKIDGIDFDVPQNMKYTDPDQNLYINLKKGMQHLDGEKAMQLVRFRSYPMGDLQRNKVQQDFLTAVAKKMMSITNITKLPDFAKILSENLETSLTLTQITRLGIEALSVDTDAGLSFYSLPVTMGENYKGADYVYLDKAPALEMVNEYINPYTAKIKDIDSLIVKNGKLIKTKGSVVEDSGKKEAASSKNPSPKPTPAPSKKPETVRPEEPGEPDPSPSEPPVEETPQSADGSDPADPAPEEPPAEKPNEEDAPLEENTDIPPVH